MWKFFGFYGRVFLAAFRPSVGIADGIGFLLGLVLAVITKLYPKEGAAMAELNWQLPLIVLGGVFAFRLILAPFWIHQEQSGRIDELEKETKPSLVIEYRDGVVPYCQTQDQYSVCRIALLNTGSRSVRDVSARVKSIEPMPEGIYVMPLRLRPTNGPKDAPLTLHPRAPEFVNVASLSLYNGLVNISHAEENVFASLKMIKGPQSSASYVLEIEVTGESVPPVSQRFRVVYDFGRGLKLLPLSSTADTGAPLY